ncbi:uncharacterized protein LOC126295252 [Schistocerca gregaria]|uniref:uncharacterized protein LOC126295252 n=1 Tax=Schistocerca gregaria TaxID=7010 RepID=UPI00211EACFE|nr:uncharacterized protein LOC126295252 [Schistocerca gregaria]
MEHRNSRAHGMEGRDRRDRQPRPPTRETWLDDRHEHAHGLPLGIDDDALDSRRIGGDSDRQQAATAPRVTLQRVRVLRHARLRVVVALGRVPELYLHLLRTVVAAREGHHRADGAAHALWH